MNKKNLFEGHPPEKCWQKKGKVWVSRILIQMEDNDKNKNLINIKFAKLSFTHKSQVSLGVGDGQRYISNIYQIYIKYISNIFQIYNIYIKGISAAVVVVDESDGTAPENPYD